MKIDLQRDAKTLRKYIRQRVRDYPIYVNVGPGNDEDPITLITLGYHFNQSGYVALVFDTRPDAEIDGEWTLYLEPENLLEFDNWFQAFNEMVTAETPISLTLGDGSKKSLKYDDPMDEIAETFGNMIRDVILESQNAGLFKKLPRSSECSFSVEELDDFFGWTDREEEGETQAEYLSKLDGNVTSKALEDQIAHWIRVLDRVAKGKENESGWSFLADEHALERLDQLGDQAIVPMLKFVRTWANKLEFDGDRPKKVTEFPMQNPTIGVLMHLHKSGCQVPEAEQLLREILRRSVKVNEGRKLWGIMPVWTARCLHRHFEGYPEPKDTASGNKLVNHEKFLARRRLQN